jgi:hypothetical protein
VNIGHETGGGSARTKRGEMSMDRKDG